MKKSAQQLIKELNLPDDTLYDVLRIMYQQELKEFHLKETMLEYPEHWQE